MKAQFRKRGDELFFCIMTFSRIHQEQLFVLDFVFGIVETLNLFIKYEMIISQSIPVA